MHPSYQTDFFKLFIFEAFLVLLISTGALDRSFAFLLLTMLAAFFITKPLKESLALFLVSLPFFIALPLGGQNDSTSVWRPLSLLLVILWLWERRDILWWRPLAFWEQFLQRKPLLYLTIAWFIYIGIAIISLAWTHDLGQGLRTLIYYINVSFVLFVYAWEVTGNELSAFLKYSLLALGTVLFIGFLQFAITFSVSLFTFWQWWAANPVLAYYGIQTSHLVSFSNTWFSYYGKDIPATLRMFSVFQDSHSFAMFITFAVGILGAFFLTFYDTNDTKGKWLAGGLTTLSLLAIILSGSRGAWLGALLLVLLLIVCRFVRFSWFSIPERLIYIGLACLLVFFLLFPISSLLLAIEQKAQLVIEGRGGQVSFDLAFLRARSTFDIGELSNKGRLEIWKDSLRFLANHKFIQGTGIGNFPTALKLTPEKTRVGASAHSLYLQMFTELGIFGFISFLIILFLILKEALRILLQATSSSALSSLPKGYKLQAYFAFAFLFSFTWILLYSLVDVTLLNDKVFLLTAILIGMLYGIQKPKTLPHEQH